MSWSRHEANVLARAELGPNFAPSHDAANGRVARELPVASALLNRRVIAHKLPFSAQNETHLSLNHQAAYNWPWHPGTSS